MWNNYTAILDGRDKTNNKAEGFNHAFNITVPKNASEWVIINQFKKEEAMARVALTQAAAGIQLPDHNTNKTLGFAFRREEMAHTVRNYRNMPLKLYLDSIATNFL